jgi:hypothetical protein
MHPAWAGCCGRVVYPRGGPEAMAKDYRACLEGVALLGERDLEGAVAVLEPLVGAEDCAAARCPS